MIARLAAPRWDFWARYFLFAALLGVILGQWLLLGIGLVLPDGLGHLHSILFCALYVPLAVVPATLWLVWRRWRTKPSFRERPRGSDLRWTLLGLGAFLAWSQSYLVVARLVQDRPLHYFSAAFEDRLPFVPAATLVYLTVYWFAALPLFLLRDPVPWRRVVAAYLLTLLPCLAAFVLYPVAMARPTVDPGADLFHWALATVHRADPPYNCFPSSHCAMALLGGLLLFEVDRRLGRLGVLYACAIGVSTLLTRQHYLIDVLAGFALAGTAYWVTLRRGRGAPARPLAGAPPG
jgi:membrane-associated phospholipid phosphatase